MAVYRQSPTCPKCGQKINAIYRDVNKGVTDPMKIFIGDTFERWDWSGHDKECKEIQRDKKIDEILKNN